MAELLNYDSSNLSKFELGVKDAPYHIILGYHVLSNTPLPKYFREQILSLIDVLSKKTMGLITDLQEEAQTPKIKARVQSLHNVLDNIGCLKVATEEKEDHEQ